MSDRRRQAGTGKREREAAQRERRRLDELARRDEQARRQQQERARRQQDEHGADRRDGDQHAQGDTLAMPGGVGRKGSQPDTRREQSATSPPGLPKSGNPGTTAFSGPS